jgi:hypothetical protein
MIKLQVTVAHKPTITTTVERHTSQATYSRNGGRKKKDATLYSTAKRKMLNVAQSPIASARLKASYMPTFKTTFVC